MTSRYGELKNLPDFVRKAQLANYEGFRAMYEGRNAQLFHPTTAIITWMSNPAQPSFVWQLYHYDLEANSSLYAVMHAGELVHIQYNEANGQLQVINNLPTDVTGATAKVTIYNVDGTVAAQNTIKVTAPVDVATDLGVVEIPEAGSAVKVLKLELDDAAGKAISSNVYWEGRKETPDDLTALNEMPKVTLTAEAATKDADGTRTVTVTVHNTSANIALMAHLQLRRKSGERVLPAFYSDNYISLVPGESRTITITADASVFHGEDALVDFDGWNVTVAPATFAGVSVGANADADPETWAKTGLPFQTVGLRQ
jgi:hypothetical protein